MDRNKQHILGIDCIHAACGLAGSHGVRYRSLGILLPQFLWAFLPFSQR